MTILALPYYGKKDSIIDYYKLQWKSKDSINGNLIRQNINGEIFSVGFEDHEILLLRFPKYTSEEARAILINKKTDLDLELITQKQYDSIKNKLSRYITD